MIADDFFDLLAAIPNASTSAIILLALFAIFAASWTMFRVLADESTDNRQRRAMSLWGRERGYRFRGDVEDLAIPPPLDSVALQRLQIHASLTSKTTTLLNIESFPAAGQVPAGETPMPGGTWRLLIRRIETQWPPTGLRPVGANASVLDLFSLTSFPLLGASERFVVYGTESTAAAKLSRSSARGLLPADIGLLLHGRSLVLDFSARPFDAVEFERMAVVADQIVGHLPNLVSAKG